MAAREYKDTATQREKRAMAANLVFIRFTEPNSFEVLEHDPKLEAQLKAQGITNKAKYFGKVSDNKETDECSCASWVYGMAFEKTLDGSRGESRYKAENGIAYQCKHIIKARYIRYGEKIE